MASGILLTAAVFILLANLAHAQDSQFLFDANGNLFAQAAEVTVPPQILGQPQNRVVVPGEAASFFVVAADTRALSYQWRFNGTNTGGATNDALLVQSVSTNNEGEYRVVLTNPSGSVTSAPAMLWIDSDGDGLPDSWERTYFGSLTNTATADFDGDGVANLTEFGDGTNPTNSASVRFRLTVLNEGGGVVELTPTQPSYTNGETVTLTGTAFAPNIFHAWIGDANTRSNPITLTMTTNKAVRAYFSPIAFVWTNISSGDWNVAANWSPNFVPSTNDTVIITNTVTVTLNTPADCADVTLGSSSSGPTLTGSGTLKVRGVFSWISGTMSGGGRTIIEAGATLNAVVPGVVFLNGRTLENGGTVLWTGAGSVGMNPPTVITNRAGALFEMQNAVSIVANNGDCPFNNAGTFRKSVNPGTITFPVSFNNSGTVDIQTGTLSLKGGGTQGGTFTVPAGTALALSGNHTATGSSSITGAGQLMVSGGNSTLAGLVNVSGSNTFSGGAASFTGNTICTNNTVIISGGTANFSGTGLVSPAVVDLSNGTLGGTGTVTVNTVMNWTGGAMSDSGRTIIKAGATLNAAISGGAALNGHTLENGGTALWTGTVSIVMNPPAVITNRAGALFEVQNAVPIIQNNGLCRFDNAGTFRKSVNSGTTTIPNLNNSGTVDIQAGTLSLSAGGSHSGSFSEAAGTALALSGNHTADGSSSITGAGQLMVSGGNSTLAGLVNVSGSNTFSGGTVTFTGNHICTNNTITVSGGTANFSGTGLVTPAVLNLSSGALGGTSTVTVNNVMNWTGGAMSDSGRTIIKAGATLNAAISGGAALNGHTLENGGTALWTGAGSIVMNPPAVITNRAGALFEVQNAVPIIQNNGLCRFDNTGTVRKSVSSGTTTIPSFNNFGTVDIRRGILAAGSYVPSPNALLNCALGGTTPGTGYGQLQVSGTVTLNGGLRVDLINGFVPATNNAFTVLTAGTRNGTFANFSYPSNAVAMQLSNTANSVIVRITGVFIVPQPAPVPAGLISWWRAEGNALDSVGTNHGVLTDGAAFATGQVGQTFALDGVNDYVQVTDSASLRPASVAIETWVKFFATNGIRIVLVKPLGSSTFDSYGLALQDGAVLAAVADNSGFGPFLTGPANTVTGQWYHLAYTFDDSSKQQALYVNGIPVASGTANKTMSYDTHPVLLGADVENGVLSFFHNGHIDEASIYNRALTPDEIATIYNAGVLGKQALTPYEQWKQTYLGDYYASDTGDPDGDGFTNLAEYTADTNPTNALSNLRISGVTPAPAGIALQWQGGTLATQFVQRSFGLGPASSWQDIFTNLPPTPNPSSFTNSAGTSDAQFYRIRVTR